MPAAWASAAVGAASLVSGLASSGSVNSAADTAKGISQATVTDAKTNYSPYTTTGANALTTYANAMGLNGQDAANSALSTFQASPSYQYSLDQGLQAVDAGAASKGMMRSGSTIKAEQTLGTNLANQDFTNYLSRLNNLTQTGLSATNGYENVATGQSTNQQQTTTQAATQDASIYGNTAKGVTGALSNYLTTNNSSGSNNAFNGAGTTGTFDATGFGSS